jgi:Styrene monooxygenase A putative substrate binding domain
MMKRSIAIIGAGHAGLLAAHGLVRAGYPVTVYSDRTPEEMLTETRPTGTAARFEYVLRYERALDLCHWDGLAPRIRGAHLTVCEEPGNRLLTMAGRLQKPALAIDLRLQCARWLEDLKARGGDVVIEPVTRARLERIASEHDLTIVATGKADLANIFARDAARSPYDRPQRNLAMLITRGARMGFDGVPFLPVRFNIFTKLGEVFWVPYYHKDHGPTFNLIFEAKPGTAFDRFGGAKSGAEALAIAKQFIRDFIPWDDAWARDMELADPNGWLIGAVTPVVRKPVAELANGRLVLGLGDAVKAVDPIAAQGANNASHMAQNLVDSIIAHEDRPFDAAFLSGTFERFYERFGQVSDLFTRILLEPITPATQELLIAQYGSDGIGDSPRQVIANAFTENFGNPTLLTNTARDLTLARAYIAEKTGKPWFFAAAAGRLAIAASQARQRFGLAPRHPEAEAHMALTA